jgi:hypothetical protein
MHSLAHDLIAMRLMVQMTMVVRFRSMVMRVALMAVWFLLVCCSCTRFGVLGTVYRSPRGLLSPCWFGSPLSTNLYKLGGWADRLVVAAISCRCTHRTSKYCCKWELLRIRIIKKKWIAWQSIHVMRSTVFSSQPTPINQLPCLTITHFLHAI